MLLEITRRLGWVCLALCIVACSGSKDTAEAVGDANDGDSKGMECPPGYVGADCLECAEGWVALTKGVCVSTCAEAGESCGKNAECSEENGLPECVCSEGYKGEACTSCSEGWQDNDGDEVCAAECGSVDLECGSHGVCSAASGTAVCECDEGFSGPQCKECAPGLQDNDGDGSCLPSCAGLRCGDAGTCSDAVGPAECICEAGYSGVNCETCAEGYQDQDGDGTCTVDCTDVDCGEYGVCKDDDGQALCACDEGYAGESCGSCAEGYQDLNEDGTCHPSCETAMLDCGTGSCDDSDGVASCVCLEAYTGDDCKACAAGYQDNDSDGVCTEDCATSLLDCGDHGVCVDASGAALCLCDAGYAGDDCKACATGYQDNDNDGVCTEDCATSQLDCGAHGTCVDTSGTALCLCDVGYAGDLCDSCGAGYQDNDSDGVCTEDCATSPLDCGVQGTCVDTAGTTVCVCNAGYAGDYCDACAEGYQDYDLDGECLPSCEGGSVVCGAHGTCVDASGVAVCSCDTGYVGALCDECDESYLDNDGDGVCKIDSDGDEYVDEDDVFPDDIEEWDDSDCDGAGDNSDPKPTDPTCAGSIQEKCNGIDDDCDGLIDELDAGVPCAQGCNPDSDQCIQCGNELVDPGEECDDGPDGSAGCSPTCYFTGQATEQTVLVLAYINKAEYEPWGQELADQVTAAGGVVTYLLNPTDGTVAAELATVNYDQLWFFDLESTTKEWPTDAQAIANFHNGLPVKNIILDGRITGDLWHPPQSKEVIENYYVNIKEKGGGAVYMTDHDVFCNYMFNLVMSHIGYEGCSGKFYGGLPFDEDNILMSYPNQLSEKTVPLYNDSTTGAVPYGPQDNGEILYSLAYYGGNPDTPAISTTIEGGLGFHVEIVLPTPLFSVFQQDPLVFEGAPSGGNAPITYTWSSDLDGDLGVGNPLTTSLSSAGTHFIELYAVDALGRTDTDVRLVNVIPLDVDNDDVEKNEDNCPTIYNPEQLDTDQDGKGNACDFDDDGDGICDSIDTTPLDPG